MNFVCKNLPIWEIPIFGQNVRLNFFAKIGRFWKYLFLGKSKVNPFAFLQKLADLGNTDFCAKCKVNPFAFLPKLANFADTDFWAEVR